MSSSRFSHLHFALPDWVDLVVPPAEQRYERDEEKMRLALTLAAENIRRGEGGPFGAAIFDAAAGSLLAVGVNQVVPSRWSAAHAEMVAYAVAQQRLGSHDLGAPGMPVYEIFSSTEPCAMCMGATLWAGVRRLVCSARGEDAEAIGFDEGPKPANWPATLEERGISVKRDLLREEGIAVLQEYSGRGGDIYNSRRGSQR
ncbi:MAG: nucleoside deaminase [Spirochaetaceae bacterium]